MSKYLIITLIFFCCKVFFVFSQKEIVYTNESDFISISPNLYIYEDETAKLNVNDLLSNDSIKFSKTKQLIPSFSFTNSVVWCKFRINNHTNKIIYLDISPPILNQVCLYQIHGNQVIDSVYCGSFYTDQNQNTFKSANCVFKLDSLADYYLLKVKSKTRLFIKAHVGSYSALAGKTNFVFTLNGLYAGMVLMIFLFHIFLFISSREKIYLYYLFHLMNTGVFFLYISGFGINYIWDKLPIINSYFIAIMSLGYVLTILFVINFLESRKNLPTIHKLLLVAIGLLTLNSLIDFAGYSNLSGRLLNYVGLFVLLPILSGTFKLLKKGFNPAYTFLSAWILYMFGVGIQTLQSLNFIPTNEFTANSIQIGSSLEIILLAIAVGKKLNFYKLGKLTASSGAKKLLLENEVLKKNEKERLEERYQAQTELLYLKNKELKKQNKEISIKFEEITEQNRKIEVFHELLETKNKIITRQNDELITHKENLEQLIEERTWELQEATRLAEEADQLKTAFLKNFSHELRTPMNAIAGFSSLMIDIDPEDKSFDYYSGIIMENTDNLLELIDNIIDLSRLQSGEFFLKKIKFDPAKMFIALKEKFQEKLRKEKKSFIELMVDIPQFNKSRINLDYNRFWKIVYQLLDNSVKYTEAGYIKFGFKQIEGNHSIELFVEDSGIGIKKEKLEVVFESFSKVDKNKMKFYPGVGVGLSMVKGLVKIMEGELFIHTVSSADSPDKSNGTSIKVIIPNAYNIEI
jgi:signal transduction histidine kinase